MPTDFWAKLLAGPLVEKARVIASEHYYGKGTTNRGCVSAACKNCKFGGMDYECDLCKLQRAIADELLAHLRESGICELLEAANMKHEEAIELGKLVAIDALHSRLCMENNEREKLLSYRREIEARVAAIRASAKAKLLAKGEK